MAAPKLTPWTDPSTLSSEQISPLTLNVHSIIFFNLWRVNYYGCSLHRYLYDYIYSVEQLEDECWLALRRTEYFTPEFQQKLTAQMEAAYTAPHLQHIPEAARPFKVKGRMIRWALSSFLMPMPGTQTDRGIEPPQPPDELMQDIDRKLAGFGREKQT
jgi:hypothetical protein